MLGFLDLGKPGRSLLMFDGGGSVWPWADRTGEHTARHHAVFVVPAVSDPVRSLLIDLVSEHEIRLNVAHGNLVTYEIVVLVIGNDALVRQFFGIRLTFSLSLLSFVSGAPRHHVQAHVLDVAKLVGGRSDVLLGLQHVDHLRSVGPEQTLVHDVDGRLVLSQRLGQSLKRLPVFLHRPADLRRLGGTHVLFVGGGHVRIIGGGCDDVAVLLSQGFHLGRVDRLASKLCRFHPIISFWIKWVLVFIRTDNDEGVSLAPVVRVLNRGQRLVRHRGSVRHLDFEGHHHGS